VGSGLARGYLLWKDDRTGMSKKQTKEQAKDAAEKTKEIILPVSIADEMRVSYLDYAMSVIVSRALPDVRDGLKPVHRRILYAMNQMGLVAGKPYRKAAGVVGEVLKNYHPHGDVAVYDTIVRLAQDFSSRYPLVAGQGNFGSVDGDPPAAMRYTEVRLTRIAGEMLADIDEDTVDFVPNYDESTTEPVLLPSRIPNLLINGSSGIAVGMATNIPPHNLGEVISGLLLMLDNPSVSIDELMKVIKGPDFPTGAKILGRQGIKDAYRTGRGSITMEAETEIEEIKGGRETIIVKSIPFQVNKAQLIENIADLVQSKKIEGISDIRDESDRKGIRVVIELRRDANAQVILNKLIKHTNLRMNFGVIMLALVEGQPAVLNLRQILSCYISHRQVVITRRTQFRLEKAKKRAHILEGLKIAIANLDKVIRLIRESKNVDLAREGLMKNFKLTQEQAQAILDMRLQNLTALEREKIDEEYTQLLKDIEGFKSILASPKKVDALIKEELEEVKKEYADPRRSVITGAAEDIDIEDLIDKEDVVVTLSHAGYIKTQPIDLYRAQHRGGRGVTGMETREEDFVEDIFITNTHDHLLFFTNRGKVYWLRVFEIPAGNRYSRGKAIVNLLQFVKEEKIAAAMPVQAFDEKTFVLMATRQGLVKRTAMSAYSNPRPSGIIALKLRPGDELISVKPAMANQDIVLATRHGKAIRFPVASVREIGRAGFGVKGMKLGHNDQIVGMEVVEKGVDLLTVTELGFAKRTGIEEYRQQGRGGSGLINLKVADRNGSAIGILAVREGDQVMVITASGTIIRTDIEGIRETGRSAQGVRLIKLDAKDKVSGITHLAAKDDEEEPEKGENNKKNKTTAEK